jgi:hypothetical protein
VHRDLHTYQELFTDDLVFQYQYRDTAGNLFADSLGRTTMIDSAATIFSIASGIRLDYVAIDPAEPDPHPGKDPLWHQTVAVKFNLLIRTAIGSIVLSPVEDFFLTRGDSAQIPADLQARGFGPDPNRWYISRWEDNTYIPPPPAPAGAEFAPAADTRTSGGPATEPGRVSTTPWPPGKALHAARSAGSSARVRADIHARRAPLATERRLR